MRSDDAVGSLSRRAPARSSARNGSGGARVAISRTRGAARRRRDGVVELLRQSVNPQIRQFFYFDLLQIQISILCEIRYAVVVIE